MYDTFYYYISKVSNIMPNSSDKAEKRDKREKFVQLSEKRVNQAIKYLRLIGNLGNRTNYIYSNADVEKIFKTLQDTLKDAKDNFKPEKTEKNKNLFTLD